MSEKETNNTSGEDEKESQDQESGRHIQVAPYGWYSPDEDEIDLADLFGVLYRRRVMIALTTVLFVVLAFGASQILTEKYNFSAILEIGKIMRGDNFVTVESPTAVSNKLTAFAKAVEGQMSEETEELGFLVKNDLDVDAPEDGNVVTVDLTAPESARDNALEFLSRINGEIIRDHSRIFDQLERSIQSEISKEEIEIQKLETGIKNVQNKISELKRQYEEQVKQRQNVIKSLENTIENTQNQKEFSLEKISLLQQEKEGLAERIQEIEARYSRLLDSKLAANEEAKGTDAVGLMLFNSEIMQTQNYLSKLRDRLLLEIPEDISQLEVDIKGFDNTLAELHEQKTLEQKRLANLQPELNEKIEELEGQINVLKANQRERELNIEDAENRLKNMIKTNVIVEPRMSDEPVAPNVNLIVALGFVGGAFLAVFLAFMLDFWSRNKQKITG